MLSLLMLLAALLGHGAIPADVSGGGPAATVSVDDVSGGGPADHK